MTPRGSRGGAEGAGPPHTTIDGEALHGRGARASSAGPATLIAVHPPGLSWELTLGEATLEIGRGGAGAARLDDATVSRRHLEISWDAGAGHHLVRDLGSRNGARVDGQRLGDRPAALADHSVVRLGDVFAIYQRGAAQPDDRSGALPGRSAAMAAVRAQVAAAAPDPSSVLISGETGTGKEWIARALHAGSGRHGPLIAVNCAALGHELLESQLFGHLRGAFTGATTDQPGLFRAADGGTLFLDEVGELPRDLQPKLLRVLQDREVLAVGATRPIKVDVRVCAATNRELAAAVERDEFRRDLHARLALWEIQVPPLRARRVDLLDWLARLEARWCSERGRPSSALALAPGAVELILLHPWRDNLRGLERLVHAVALRRSDGAITLADLPGWLTQGQAPVAAPGETSARERPPAPSRLELEQAYAALDGNVRALARKYGRDRKQIYRWLEAYGLARRGSS